MLALVGSSSRHSIGLCRLNTGPVSWERLDWVVRCSLELGGVWTCEVQDNERGVSPPFLIALRLVMALRGSLEGPELSLWEPL
jgi:hypothetical protein